MGEVRSEVTSGSAVSYKCGQYDAVSSTAQGCRFGLLSPVSPPTGLKTSSSLFMTKRTPSSPWDILTDSRRVARDVEGSFSTVFFVYLGFLEGGGEKD